MLSKKKFDDPMFPSILQSLTQNYPDFRFKNGPKFSFRPPRTIYFNPSEPHADFLIFHELGHAVLKHRNFNLDIERLKMENAAWETGQKLALQYNIKIDEDFIQDELDTYRNWLHQKSLCKKCHTTRYQAKTGEYICPFCH